MLDQNSVLVTKVLSRFLVIVVVGEFIVLPFVIKSSYET